MKTSKIVIKNLFGIRETTLDGKSVEISGPKGAGKTSVLDAIRFALTNRSERDCIVHQGADEGEIIIETTTGLSIDRKALPAKSAGTVKVRDGSLLQTRPAEFLSQIFTPLQLNPVEFTQLSRQEKNRVILSLIEFDWDVNWIREQFGEIPQGVDYSKHILEVLNDIQAENGVYFQSRQNINRDIRNKQAFISDIAKDIPSGYDYDRWNQYPIGDRYRELERLREKNSVIERAKAFRANFTSKLRGLEGSRDVEIGAIDRDIAAERAALTGSIERMKAELQATEEKLAQLSRRRQDRVDIATANFEAAKAKLEKDVGVAEQYADQEPVDTTALAAEVTNAEEMRKHLNEYGREPNTMSDYRHWTSDEEKYIQDHWRLQTDGEMAAALDRSEGAVRTKRRELRCSPQKTWTPEELQYLEDHWGTVSIPGIAKKLGRTVNAIKVRVARMGLGGMLNSGDYVTFNQLMRELTDNSQSYSYQMKSWVKNRGMPIHTKRVNACSFRVVYLEEFWEWAEQHRSFIDFSKLEPLALGKEPDWVAEQRRKDYQSFALQRKDPWSPDEDNNLIRLLKQQKYGYAELSEILRRSEGAIVRRCRDLGLKERPVRADSHRKGGSWSDEQHQILADGIRHGDSYSMIGRVIGKSEKALRGKIYFTYLTEDADKVRAMLGDGPWGHGAPEPTVRQGFSLSKTRTEVRKNLSILDALLRKRMNDLGYDPYWQRFMCANWDPVKGCSADCADCDSCTEFQRIRPQYCRMCGGEFLERKEQTYCPKCRAMRKKQAQKKYAVLHARGRY